MAILRHVLFFSTTTVGYNAKDPYISDFYWGLREQEGMPHKIAIVAMARKMLVSLFHMLLNDEPYHPPEVDT